MNLAKLDIAQRGAVTIEKKGRPVAIVMSMEEYQRLQDCEDALWATKAIAAGKEGFLTEDESKQFLNALKQKLQGEDV